MSSSKPHYIGTASLTPATPVPAGSWGTWTIRYIVPAGGIDDGGAVRVACRFVTDWMRPQLDNPSGDHYLTVSCTRPETKLVSRWQEVGGRRPYQHHLLIQILDAPLEASDEIRIIYGDTSGGGRGTRAQTFVEDRFEFQIFVDRLGAGVFEPLTEHPAVPIVPNESHRLVVVVGGDPLRVLIKAEDIWGNPIRTDIPGEVQLTVRLDGNQLSLGDSFRMLQSIELRAGQCVVRPKDCEAGILRIVAEHPTLGRAESNPVRIGAPRYWGDLHAQSGETVGTNSAESYFRFARDSALADFVGHQGNDIQITDKFWTELNRLSRTFTKPGKFIVIPGYEWSGLTPVGGDRNVLYLHEGHEIHRSSLAMVHAEAHQLEDETPLPKLYASLKKSPAPVLLIPHISGRRSNLDFHDPELEPVIEIHSCWGTFEWFYHDALRRGYRVGVVANSDSHKGRPAAEHAGAGRFGVYGGLTCILADKLDRPALFTALQHRHCYGTSGPRILVDATLAGKIIGSDVTATALPLRVEVIGTAGIERIDLLAAGKPVAAWEETQRSPNRIRIRWSGARILNRNRATNWTGSLRITGNTITAVEGFAFDSPAEGIQSWDVDNVRWSSITTGDEDGLILTLADGLKGSLAFQAEPLQCEISLSELPATREAGKVEQRVIFEVAPIAEQREVVWTTDVVPDPALAIQGQIPLHLRITQVDGHRAWTSPWFVKGF